jgi:hypothetical protein
MKKSAAESRLEALYKAAGLPCSIDAGNVGFVIYAASRADVMAIVESIGRALTGINVSHSVSEIGEEPDEPAATRHYSILAFNWDEMPSSVSECVGVMAPKAVA